MKKYLVILILILFSSNFVQAQGVNFYRDLSVGVEGDDVSLLQTWLISNGFDIPAVSSGMAVKGYFGQQTKMAVIRMQLANGIPNTGYVGPLTRGKLNGSSQGNALRVLSPNGNETLAQYTTHRITWTGSPGILNQKGTIKIQTELPACLEPKNGGPVCLMAMPAPLDVATVDLSAQSYNWNVGTWQTPPCPASYVCTPPAPLLGKYKVLICSSDSAVCDKSDDYFNVVNVQTPTKLLITSPNGGENWIANTNQIINWTVLGKSIPKVDIYLDELYTPNCAPGTTCMRAPQRFVLDRNIDATKPYGWITATDISNVQIPAGTWTVRVCEAGSTTNCDSSDTYFTISPSAQSPKVVRPNGGEVWAANSTQTLQWTPSIPAVAGEKVNISLYDDVDCSHGCVVPPKSFVLDNNIPVGSVYNWIVATDINDKQIPSGSYKLRVCQAAPPGRCDSSDGFFTILSSVTRSI